MAALDLHHSSRVPTQTTSWELKTRVAKIFYIHFFDALNTKNVMAPMEATRVHTANFTIGLLFLASRCESVRLFVFS